VRESLWAIWGNQKKGRGTVLEEVNPWVNGGYHTQHKTKNRREGPSEGVDQASMECHWGLEKGTRHQPKAHVMYENSAKEEKGTRQKPRESSRRKSNQRTPVTHTQ